MPQSKFDAVVIGSGISGLTTAALLAKNGRRVAILEKDRKPGGALRRFSRSGIPFDIGFHYTGGLARNQILRILWEHIGIWDNLTATPLHPDGYDLFKFANSDTTVRAYYSYELLTEELCRVFPTESVGIRKYLQTVRDICHKNPFYNPDVPLVPFLRDFFGSGDSSLTAAVSAMVRNPELQAVFSAPACLHGVPPHKVGIAMHASVAHGYYSGAWGIQGGGQAIANAFIGQLQQAGVEIITGCPAEQITVSDGRVSGVKCNKLEISAENVIYTGHPAAFPDLVAEGAFRPAYCSRLRDLEDTMSVFIVFGMLDNPGLVPNLDRGNMYMLNPGFNLMESHGEGTTLLMTAPGRRDDPQGKNGAAAKGVILMQPSLMEEAAVYGDGFKSRKAGYSEWKESLSRKMIEKATESFGEGCSTIKVLATGSPLTFSDELGSPAGGVYGVQHNMHQFVARARTRIGGLFLSGQGSLMTGVLGASLAGLVTAGEIMGLEETWNRVRNCQ
ncbi:MAG: NAD(P)/FAD-dependent oxidoreductase [Proteobacteria bacterium]|nr:NAD(P)/FAD-dependent oxidoreductase [Pseudomonadota bacterium]MBU1739133.1 NAD(P)/FAD-dependent oxidoreductase [Pseudomonadota bacterium]